MCVSITANITIPLRKELATLEKYFTRPFGNEIIKPPEQGLERKSRTGKQGQNRKSTTLHRK